MINKNKGTEPYTKEDEQVWMKLVGGLEEGVWWEIGLKISSRLEEGGQVKGGEFMRSQTVLWLGEWLNKQSGLRSCVNILLICLNYSIQAHYVMASVPHPYSTRNANHFR